MQSPFFLRRATAWSDVKCEQQGSESILIEQRPTYPAKTHCEFLSVVHAES